MGKKGKIVGVWVVAFIVSVFLFSWVSDQWFFNSAFANALVQAFIFALPFVLAMHFTRQITKNTNSKTGG